MKRLSIEYLLVFFIIIFVQPAQAQDSLAIQQKTFETSAIDSSFLNEVNSEKFPTDNLPDSTIFNKKGKKIRQDRFLYKVFKEDYPNPKTAMMLSFALPGTGQIYNRRWWKPPLVYGGMGLSIYNIVRNTNKYRRFRDAYIQKLAGEPTEFQGQRFDNANDLKTLRDGYDKNRQLSFVAAILVYGIQGAEAFVDAHLRTFDVSDDLSLRLRLKPSVESDRLTGTYVGIGLSFQLDKRVD